MNIFEILNLRSRFEEIITDINNRYELPAYDGSINNLEWFVDNAHKSNRFRNNFDEALDIANTIIENKGTK